MTRLVVLFSVSVASLGVSVPQSGAQVIEGRSTYLALYWRPSIPLANKLAQRVDFEGFDNPKLTLRDGLETLALRHEFTIDVDELEFCAAGCPDVLDERITLTPIPRMKDIPLSTVLSAILERIPSTSGATYIFRSDWIEITTHRRAAIEGWRGCGVLIEDSMAKISYTVEQIKFSGLTEVRIDLMGIARRLGEINYWKGVMNENARAAVTDANQARPRKVPVKP